MHVLDGDVFESAIFYRLFERGNSFVGEWFVGLCRDDDNRAFVCHKVAKLYQLQVSGGRRHCRQ